ncbi:dipeptidase [Ectobacillus funiculus]|uniref:dipeptidase n=1 Tax=Ectobacillus funiculus TaxID=137993 RepID=UPI00101D78A1|nr:dipeptidase [Ectobacillus funiculus]
MVVFDAHCDVLWQIWQRKRRAAFNKDDSLHVTLEGLKKGKGKLQCFAVYVPEEVPHEQRFEIALEMIHIFYEDILKQHPEMKLVSTRKDILALQEEEIGALLTLEGCDAIGSSLTRLQTLYRLGVRSVGLTWNYANAVADGALETRGAGLSDFGKQVVQQLNEYRLWTDVSHLSERGFWDVMQLAHFPIASHSNCYSLCPHPRNLKDEQIRALIARNGRIGITFVPMFLTEGGPAAITHILQHLEHICSLGGEHHVGFGSDFDGITETVHNLGRYAEYENLKNELVKHYTEEQVHSFLYGNFMRGVTF